jgi:hypothetical protein
MKMSKRSSRQKERGVAMMIAMLSIVLLAIIGMAFMFMANTENAVNSNYKSSQKAYFASRGGLENVRVLLLQGGNLYNQASAMSMPNSAFKTGVIYVFNSAGASDPTRASGTTIAANPALDDELCHEQFVNMAPLSAGSVGVPCGSGPGGTAELTVNANYYSTPTVAVNTSTVPFTWVRITNKQNYMGLAGLDIDGSNPATAAASVLQEQVCFNANGNEVVMGTATPTCKLWNAANPLNLVNPVLVLTSLAVTPGGTRRMTQMEVAYIPPIYPQGAITAEAPITITGSLDVNGFDNCTCTATGAPKVVGGTCNSAYAVASGNSITTNGSSSTLVGKDPPTQVLNPWPYDVPQIINNYVNSGPVNVGLPGPNQATSCSGTPNFTAIPAVYANCSNITGKNGVTSFGQFPTDPNNPTDAKPQTTYVPGSVSLHSDVTGSGVLIIDGDLDVNGSLSWYGLILVRGRISFTGGGSANVNLYGALLAGEDVNAQDIAIGDKVGGSFSFHYDTCALKLDGPAGPPMRLATHEVMY